MHDLTRTPSHFPLSPLRCNDLRNCAPICNIDASKEASVLATVYIHDMFGVSMGVVYLDLFIAVRVYLS